MLASPMLIGALVIGLIVSILQAITQINEATLTFIPKWLSVAVVFVIAAPWMLDVMHQFTTQLFENLAEMVRIRWASFTLFWTTDVNVFSGFGQSIRRSSPHGRYLALRQFRRRLKFCSHSFLTMMIFPTLHFTQQQFDMIGPSIIWWPWRKRPLAWWWVRWPDFSSLPFKSREKWFRRRWGFPQRRCSIQR